MPKNFNFKDVPPQGKISNNESRRNITFEIGIRMARIATVLDKERITPQPSMPEAEKEKAAIFLFKETAGKHTIANSNNNPPLILPEEAKALSMVIKEYVDALFAAGYTAKEGLDIYRKVEKNDTLSQNIVASLAKNTKSI